MNPPEILAQSDHFLVINKPSGMVVHRSQGAGDRYTLVSVMREALGPLIYPVNRLDRQTSGLIVMARSKDAARELSEAFAAHIVTKIYEAVVRGWPPVSREQPVTLNRRLSDRAASTTVELIAQTELDVALGRYPQTRLSRLRLFPHSGTHHQLRRHLKGWGYPIINDHQRGDSKLNAKFHEAFGIKRLLLHSYGLSFPFRDERVTVEVDWNGRTLGLLDHLGLGVHRKSSESFRSNTL